MDRERDQQTIREEPRYDGAKCAEKEFHDFGYALLHLRCGRKVYRKGWNGTGMYLALQYPDLNSKMSQPYIYIRTTSNDLVPWLASQTDMLATDWEVFK